MVGAALALALLGMSFEASGQAAGFQGRASAGVLKGTLTLRPARLGSECRESTLGAVFVLSCSQGGSFRGSYSGTGTYRWVWRLRIIAGGKIPGSGTESGSATLRLGADTLTLATTGTVARGPAPSGSASEESHGSWRLISGTGRFARLKGSGRYDFLAIERRDVQPPFSYQGRLTLTGTTG